MRSVLRTSLFILLALVLILVLLAALGAGWFLHRVQGHLEPPPSEPGQPPVATLAEAPPSNLPYPGTLVSGFDWQNLNAPPVSSHPWTRWWWPGGDVRAEDAVGQLRQLREAGFGGVEIQPFLSGAMAVEDEEVQSRIYDFDTPGYYATLDRVIAGADALGMQVDLTNMSGWPPGGPHIQLEESLTILAWGEETVQGGQQVEIDLPAPRPGPGEYIFSNLEFAGADFINFPAAQRELLSVAAYRRTGGERAWNPFNVADTLALDPASVRLLNGDVEAGRLHWDAPEGEWHVVASYLLPSGEVPIGAAQKPQGFVFDHLDREVVWGNYAWALGERTGLPAHYGRGLRGFFNDSLEFRLRRMASEDILAEFRQRRGYDLEPWLPAVYVEGVDNVYFSEILHIRAAPDFTLGDDDGRIRQDYQRTLSELMIERFIEGSADWAHERGLTSRAQSYGMDIDMLRALGANTIPETEQLWAGGSDVGLKMASSAAALYGRPLTSAESFVWINRDYTPTARRIKAAADKLFLAGINHIVYHGTPYQWQNAPEGPFGELGWAPFSGPSNPAHFSSNVGPGNTSLWPDVPGLNQYIARSQNLLRQGHPEVDVLILYPFLGYHGTGSTGDFPEVLLAGALPDADPKTTAAADPTLLEGRKQLSRILTEPPAKVDPRSAWVERLLPVLQALDRRGMTWGWLNEHAVQTDKLMPEGRLAAGGRFGAILLPNVEALEVATLEQLGELASEGVPVLLAGELPQRQWSFHDRERGDAAVQDAARGLLERGAEHLELSESSILPALARTVDLPLARSSESTVRRYTRVLEGGGRIHFLANQSPEPAELRLPALAEGEDGWWYDPLRGQVTVASAEPLVLSLKGFESRFLVTGVPRPETLPLGLDPALRPSALAERQLLGEWHVSGEGLDQRWDSLKDWRDVPSLQHARGPLRYRTTVTLDEAQDKESYRLSLGLVQGSAEVLVNGQSAGRASLPPFTVEVGSYLRPGENVVEVVVLAPLRNYLTGRALAEDPQHNNMSRYADQLVAAGLMGPVYLEHFSGTPMGQTLEIAEGDDSGALSAGAAGGAR